MTTIAKVGSHHEIVPYITPYEEQTVPLPLVCRWTAEGLRLTYIDANAEDWMFGVLWARMSVTPGATPMMSMVHTLLQRRCMLERVCRVCGQSAADPDDPARTWWILPAAPTDGRMLDSWTTAHAPTCKDHVRLALARCPHLRTGTPILYTVGHYWSSGVLANLYAPLGNGVVETHHQVPIALEEFQRLNLALATQLIVTMQDLRPASVP
ncbi:hypothetical protein AB0K21_21725 [Streptosporangium sp. NPDC049248]|uniref:hypothetical protein n=1 Tax=Streptosporangium sp. NPDC049248 TaxID=3155651 RepID=UPI00342566AA